MYGTSAALKRHMFREHMTEEEQLQTAGVKHRMIATDNMIHSASGMPQCRHCAHKFTTWHAFYYHVNTQGCPTLRELAAGQSEKADITNMSEALVENPSILSLAVQCTWRQLAEHPQTKSNHHHCPECHHWMATPQYVKRHMLLRHPDQAALVERSESLIVRSNLSLGNPCPFCGLKYQRKSAHLKSCIGIFNGVYLYLRVARGRPLTSLGEGDNHGQRPGYGDRPATAGSSHEGACTASGTHSIGAGDNYIHADSVHKPGKCINGTDSRSRTSGPSERRAQAEVPQRMSKRRTGQGQGGQKHTQSTIQQLLASTELRPAAGEPSMEAWKVPENYPWREDELMDNPAQLRATVSMLTRLVLRHDTQHAIVRQDSAFVLFVRTDAPDSLAKSTHNRRTSSNIP